MRITGRVFAPLSGCELVLSAVLSAAESIAPGMRCAGGLQVGQQARASAARSLMLLEAMPGAWAKRVAAVKRPATASGQSRRPNLYASPLLATAWWLSENDGVAVNQH
jgi:hypothetical protein